MPLTQQSTSSTVKRISSPKDDRLSSPLPLRGRSLYEPRYSHREGVRGCGSGGAAAAWVAGVAWGELLRPGARARYGRVVGVRREDAGEEARTARRAERRGRHRGDEVVHPAG